MAGYGVIDAQNVVRQVNELLDRWIFLRHLVHDLAAGDWCAISVLGEVGGMNSVVGLLLLVAFFVGGYSFLMYVLSSDTDYGIDPEDEEDDAR